MSVSNDTDEDDITLEDLNKMIPIFRWGFIISGFCIIGGIIFAGVKSWAWYIIIPLGAVLHFGNRALKTMIINGAEEARRDLHVAHVDDAGLSIDYMKFETFKALPEDEQRASILAKEYQKTDAPRRKLPINGVVLVGVLMIAVSGFWYGLGKIFSFVF